MNMDMDIEVDVDVYVDVDMDVGVDMGTDTMTYETKLSGHQDSLPLLCRLLRLCAQAESVVKHKSRRTWLVG